MSASTGVVLATGGVTFLNKWVGDNQGPDLEIVVATSIAAIGLYLLEKVNPELAVGIAWIAFVTSLIVQPKYGNSVVENLLAWEIQSAQPTSKEKK